MVGLLVELDLAPDGESFARHMKGRDIQAEKASELRFRREGQFTHAGMHAVGADDKHEGVLAATLEARIDRVAAVVER